MNPTVAQLFETRFPPGLSRTAKDRAIRYALAILVAFAALWVRGVLAPYLGERNPFHTAWLAVVIAAWWLGLGPSILAVLIESVGVWYLFLPPAHSWHFQDASVASGLVGFVIVSVLVVAFGEVNRRAQGQRAQQARMLDLSHDAIFVHGPGDRIVYWNEGAAVTYGYSQKEAVGRVAYELLRTVFPEPREALLQKVRRDGQWWGELVHTCKDGSEITVSSRWALFADAKGAESILQVNRDITIRKLAERALEEKVQARTNELAEANKQLQTLSGTLMRAQDEERRRVARELHDSAGQYLAAVAMELDSIRNDIASLDESLVRRLDHASEVTQACISEIRTLSHLLHPPLLEELGLDSAVRLYVEGFESRSGIHVELAIAEEFSRLDADVEILLFRVLQESLTNVHRHSGSKTAKVQMGADSLHAWLEVQDQGKRAPVMTGDTAKPFRAGVGIMGIRERVRNAGGSAEITINYTGARVKVVVPIGESAETVRQHAE